MGDSDSEVEILEQDEVFAHRAVRFQAKSDAEDSEDDEVEEERFTASQKRPRRAVAKRPKKSSQTCEEGSPPKKSKASPRKGRGRTEQKAPRRRARGKARDPPEGDEDELDASLRALLDEEDEEEVVVQKTKNCEADVRRKAEDDLDRQLSSMTTKLRETAEEREMQEMLKKSTATLSSLQAAIQQSAIKAMATPARSSIASKVVDPRISRLEKCVLDLRLTPSKTMGLRADLRRILSLKVAGEKKVQAIHDRLSERCPSNMKVVKVEVRIGALLLDPSKSLAEALYTRLTGGKRKLEGEFTLVVGADASQVLAAGSPQNLEARPGSFNLLVQSGPRSEEEVAIHPEEPLSRLFQRYAAMKGHDVATLRFTFDGNTVKGTETCAELELEEGMRVDVKKVV